MFRPESAFIVTTTDCNRRAECAHCFYNVQPDRSVESHLTPESMTPLLTRLRLWGVRGVYFTGGEPLMREDLPEMVQAASRMGLTAMLLSNGTLLNSALVETLDRSGLQLFVLSLPSRATLDPRIFTMLSKFKRTSLSIICVLTRKNFTQVGEVWSAAQALGARVLFQPAFIPEGHPLDAELDLRHLNPFDWSYLYASLRPWSRASDCQDYWNFVYDFYHEKKMKLPHCYLAGNAVIIDADGAVYPCFHRRDLRCGNALQDDFTDILHRLGESCTQLYSGECFGEHCLSLQTGYRDPGTDQNP